MNVERTCQVIGRIQGGIWARQEVASAERREASAPTIMQEQDVNEKFDLQIETREARYGAIRKILEENVKLRDKAEERFQSFFEKEVHNTTQPSPRRSGDQRTWRWWDRWSLEQVHTQAPESF